MDLERGAPAMITGHHKYAVLALRFVVRLANETASSGRDSFTNLGLAGEEAERVLALMKADS
jgi:hypothetical protein